MQVDWSLYNVRLLEPYAGYRTKVLFECTACESQWTTTPQVVKRSHKLHGSNGCPTCNEKRKETRYAAAKEAFLAKRPEYIEVLSHYDGTQAYSGQRVHFKNTDCGHTFWSVPTDIFNRRVICPVCGKEGRIEDLKERNKARRTDQNYDAWLEYKGRVAYLTHKNYKANKELLNPLNHPITVCGVPGGYQIDHLLPRSVAYKLGISEEEVSHVDNLQVISWEDNRQHSATIKFIPLIFRQYFTSEYLEVNSIVIDDLTSFEFELEDGLR